ncbi:putative S-adenosyl-L-methionine-dependent methyltransferase [Dillenia turbinata]|uniref:Methyltransferase n=1 Tax=Dillenia turbinata TaxID=194707 RepID=A0AAN8VRS1_9MAGN
MVDYLPCLDNAEGIGKLNLTENGENYERHCPEANQGLDCLIPRPKGVLRFGFRGRRVEMSNVRRKGLLENKVDQNSVRTEGGKVIFPAGGPKSIPGMAKYLDTISQMVPAISFGQNTQVVLDIGGGIGSFGASLLERNVSTLTIAPKDAHENQIQLALEHSVPAMFSAFATRRQLDSSQAFDLIHCSKCGMLLLEINRMLRTGGYLPWVAEPVHSQEEKVEEQWKEKHRSQMYQML